LWRCAAKDGILEALTRYERVSAQIDQNVEHFHSMLEGVKEQYTSRMLDAKAEAKDFVAKSVARWAAASDETQDVANALARSKEIISMFSASVTSGA
jgi:hypothetical protein